jgi:hypothetical protein
MLLAYLMVSMYYGMKCLGGFSQVHDLTMVKQAWTKFLEDVGDEQQAASLDPLQTKELGGDGMVLAYLRTADGNIVPATGVDMLLETNATSFEQYVLRSKVVTLTDMMTPMLPEMYVVLCPAQERKPELAAITPERIMATTGLTEKLSRDFLPGDLVGPEPHVVQVVTDDVQLDLAAAVPAEEHLSQ